MADYLEVSQTGPVNTDQLLLDVRAAVSSDVGLYQKENFHIRLKKTTTWTPAQITAVTTLVQAAEPRSVSVDGKRAVDRYPPEIRALALVMLDEVNLIRTQLGLPVRTPAQLVAAIKTKIEEIA